MSFALRFVTFAVLAFIGRSQGIGTKKDLDDLKNFDITTHATDLEVAASEELDNKFPPTAVRWKN